MSVHSEIEWTDATWNPVRGCTKISPGCKFCYAERFAERFRGVPGHPFEQGFDLRLVPEKLVDPLRWQTPKKIFVNSMSDLFHEGIPDEYIETVARVMVQANWHTFQVLTKRSLRMRDMLRSKLKFAAQQKNIWWGVSVEDKRYGVPRIAHLRQSGAMVKFLSVEPLLEDIGIVNLSGFSWMIVGGESGPGARPMDARWVRSLRRQCRSFGVKFFFKQWGGVRKHLTGRMLDGRVYNEFPERAVELVPDSGRRISLVSAIQQISGSFIPVPAFAGD
ncbi:MAG: phage Gp37/Gp68 family protein [Terracidiphilus sp.]|jgi:protein gp37